MDQEAQQRIMGFYIEEARDHLTNLEQGLMSLRDRVEDSELINDLFRAAHSIKGGAAMLGLGSIQKTAHRLEDCFKVFRERTVPVDDQLERLLLQGYDALANLLEQLQAGTLTDVTGEAVVQSTEEVFQQLETHIQVLLGEVTAAPAPEPSADQAFTQGVSQRLRDMLDIVKQGQPDARSSLQSILGNLSEIGAAHAPWQQLIQTIEQALADDSNDLRTLALVFLRDLKAAQQLVLDGKVVQIQPSADLLAKLPAAVAAIPEVPIDALNQPVEPIAAAEDSLEVSPEPESISLEPAVAEALEPELEQPVALDEPEVAEQPEADSLDIWFDAAVADPEMAVDEDVFGVNDDGAAQTASAGLNLDDLTMSPSDVAEADPFEDLVGWETGIQPEDAIAGLEGLESQSFDGSAVVSGTSGNDFSAWLDLGEANSPPVAADDAAFSSDSAPIADSNDGLSDLFAAEPSVFDANTSNLDDFVNSFPEAVNAQMPTREETNPAFLDDLSTLFAGDVSGLDEDFAEPVVEDTTELGAWMDDLGVANDQDHGDTNTDIEMLASLFDNAPPPPAAPSVPPTPSEWDLAGLFEADAEPQVQPEPDPWNDSESDNPVAASSLDDLAGLADLWQPDSPESIEAMPEHDATAPVTEASLDFENLDALFAPEQQADAQSSAAFNLASDFDDLNALFTEDPAPAINQSSDSDLSLSDLEDFLVPELTNDTTENDVDQAESDVADDIDSLFADVLSEELQFDAEADRDFAQASDGTELAENDAPLVETSLEDIDFGDLEAMLAPAESESSETAMPLDSEMDALASLLEAPAPSSFDELETLLGETPVTPPEASAKAPVTTRRAAPAPTRSVRRPVATPMMRVEVKYLDTINNLVGELVVNRNTLEQTQGRLRQFLDNLLFRVRQLSDIGQKMQDQYERSLLEASLLASHATPPQSPKQVQAATNPSMGGQRLTGESFDALEMDRFTAFHSLSQEIIELIVRIRESASDIQFVVDESEQTSRQFRQITTQLQEGLNRVRMVPFSQIADRLPRAVKDLSYKTGKQISLNVEGRDTLIDKSILEELYDPMTHLVNNAIVHGIEDPTHRESLGKAAEGTITIRTFYQGNQTIITVSDDGGGINAERVKKKAVEKRMISTAEAAEMDEQAAFELLGQPGFSTQDTADELAGRGVGLDVVVTTIREKMRGTVQIDSEMNKGTTFTLRLPLTLSVSKAMVCVSDRALIAFPLDGVEEMIDVPRDQIQKDAQGRDVIPWRDQTLHFQPLSQLLSFGSGSSRSRSEVFSAALQTEDIVPVVILQSGGQRVALQVDNFVEEQEIVIKQLAGPVPKPDGIAGATVLGNGRVLPIADTLELIDMAMGRRRKREFVGSTPVTHVEEGPRQPTVLIIDDSITVRELLSMTFAKVGYRVEQARDGQDAWDKIRSGLPCDLVFCDIEMPRMDGLEFLSRLREDSQYDHLPIAMLTSRGADRHRQMAASLGATAYFTKPYLEEELLSAANRMLEGDVLLTGKA